MASIPTQHSATILVVDDEAAMRDYLAEVLRFEGYECRCFSESLAALAYLADGGQQADLLLTDIRMPEIDGIDLLRRAKELQPGLPVILISGLYELAVAIDALQAGADDYLKKPVRPSDLVVLVGRYVRDHAKQWETRVHDELRGLLAGHQKDSQALQLVRDLFQKLGFQRFETYGHSARVAAYSRCFGATCGIADEALVRLELGSMLHDIGKIAIPRNVLLKPGPLTEEEWDMMRDHPQIGYSLLAAFPEFKTEADLIYSHHERFDGKGYPRGLHGQDIPLNARIFSIVDAYDALTSDRPYRAAQPGAVARREIERMSGAQFDPELVDTFLALPQAELEAIRLQYQDT